MNPSAWLQFSSLDRIAIQLRSQSASLTYHQARFNRYVCNTVGQDLPKKPQEGRPVMRIPRGLTLWLMMIFAALGISRVDAANISINCGGAAASPFVADVDFAGGATASVTNAIDTSLLTGTVPTQAVLQSSRYGNYT